MNRVSWPAAAAVALSLTACATAADPELGLVHAQNRALEQARPVDPAAPMEGGSAVRGAFAQQRYLTGNTRPLVAPPAPLTFEPSFPDTPVAPK